MSADNLLYAQHCSGELSLLPSAGWECVIVYGLWDERLVWLIYGALWVLLFADAGSGWPHSVLGYY